MEFNIKKYKHEEIVAINNRIESFKKLPRYVNALIVYLSLAKKFTLVVNKENYSTNIDDYIHYLVKNREEMKLKVDEKHLNIAYKIDLYKLVTLDLFQQPVFNLNRIDENGKIFKPDWIQEYSLVLINNLEYFNLESQTFRYLIQMLSTQSIHSFNLKNIYFIIPTDNQTIDYLEKKVGNNIQIIRE